MTNIGRTDDGPHEQGGRGPFTPGEFVIGAIEGIDPLEGAMRTPQDTRWCWGVLSRTGLSTEEGDMVSRVDMGN